MCCFSRPVRHVAKTKIFARGLDDGRQLLAYAMDVELDEELAMVLPLPVPPRSPESAVTFLDLEAYPRFFVDLEAAFPPMTAAQAKGLGLPHSPAPAPKLHVHEVGRFEASFVPTRADFTRLDERFQLSPRVWDQMPGYEDWGFAVFRLKPIKRFLGFGTKTKMQSVHPMALSFPRRHERSLFFPTKHVHDGSVNDKARFDHTLYCQTSGLLDAVVDWTASEGALGEHVDASRSSGLVDGTRPARMTELLGDHRNDDVWLREPAGVTVEDLRGAGECFEYEVRATTASWFSVDTRTHRAWKDTAENKLPALCRGMREGLRQLVEQRREVWQLTPITDELPAHFLNGDVLWVGSDWVEGEAATVDGPGRVRFSSFTKRVEPQSITLGFSSVPGSLRLAEIRHELAALLDRAVAGA